MGGKEALWPTDIIAKITKITRIASRLLKREREREITKTGVA